jgi:hypothetical protein
MKRIVLVLFAGLFAASLATAAPRVRWPREAVEWEKFKDKETLEAAAKEQKWFAFIFVPNEWPEDEDGGVGRSVAATNDAINTLKSFCVIVKGQTGPLIQVLQGGENKSDLPIALLQGFANAGNTYPLVVVLDGELKTSRCAVAGRDIYTEGAKVFREAKKKHREEQKAGEED